MTTLLQRIQPKLLDSISDMLFYQLVLALGNENDSSVRTQIIQTLTTLIQLCDTNKQSMMIRLSVTWLSSNQPAQQYIGLQLYSICIELLHNKTDTGLTGQLRHILNIIDNIITDSVQSVAVIDEGNTVDDVVSDSEDGGSITDHDHDEQNNISDTDNQVDSDNDSVAGSGDDVENNGHTDEDISDEPIDTDDIIVDDNHLLNANKHVFIDVKFDNDEQIYRMTFELYNHDLPVTCHNFIELCNNTNKHRLTQQLLTYQNVPVHEIIYNESISTGDIINHNGTTGYSIYGSSFTPESYQYQHNQRGVLSMKCINGMVHSQFLITLSSQPQYDNQHVVFGQLVDGYNVLKKMESIQCQNNIPLQLISIVNCGELIDDPNVNHNNNITISNTPDTIDSASEWYLIYLCLIVIEKSMIHSNKQTIKLLKSSTLQVCRYYIQYVMQ